MKLLSKITILISSISILISSIAINMSLSVNSEPVIPELNLPVGYIEINLKDIQNDSIKSALIREVKKDSAITRKISFLE